MKKKCIPLSHLLMKSTYYTFTLYLYNLPPLFVINYCSKNVGISYELGNVKNTHIKE